MKEYVFYNIYHDELWLADDYDYELFKLDKQFWTYCGQICLGEL